MTYKELLSSIGQPSKLDRILVFDDLEWRPKTTTKFKFYKTRGYNGEYWEYLRNDADEAFCEQFFKYWTYHPKVTKNPFDNL